MADTHEKKIDKAGGDDSGGDIESIRKSVVRDVKKVVSKAFKDPDKYLANNFLNLKNQHNQYTSQE